MQDCVHSDRKIKNRTQEGEEAEFQERQALGADHSRRAGTAQKATQECWGPQKGREGGGHPSHMSEDKKGNFLFDSKSINSDFSICISYKSASLMLRFL